MPPSPALFAASGLHVIDYVVVLLYLGAVLFAGWYFSRGQEESEDYFVAGRSMPWMAVGLSIVATLLSTVTYLAAPGEIIQHGMAFAIGWLGLPVAFLIVNKLWLPFIMRLRVVSIYEYLEQRFGPAARWTAVVLFVCILRLLWMATVVLTASRAVAQITHGSISEMLPGLSIDNWTLVVLFAVGMLASVYTMLGGIKAVIWTDVAQFIALFGGLVLTLVFVAVRTGTNPVDWFRMTTSAQGGGHEFPPLASWDITTRETILFTLLAGIFWYSCTFIADQVAVQRYLTTKDVRAAKRGNWVNFVADWVVSILLALCGMALLTYYLDPEFRTVLFDGITDPRDKAVADKVFPHFIEYGLPIGVSGLVVAALFAVAMSSLDSGMNSVSAVITVDVFRKMRHDRSARQELRIAKSITLIVGVASTMVAWAMTLIPERYNIIGITARTFNCALGPLGALFVSGMFFRHVSQRAAVIATWCGFGVAILLAWLVELMGLAGLTDVGPHLEWLARLGDQTWPVQWFGMGAAPPVIRGPSPFLITPLTTMATIAMAIGLGWLLPNRDTERAREMSWASVVRRTS